MRLDRIKAYVIDLLVILIIYTFVNSILPQSDLLKKYKSDERSLKEAYMEQKIDLKDYTEQYEDIYYHISYESKLNNLIYLVSLLVYFVVLPYFFNGQTLGLFLNKLRIERFTDGKIHMYQYLIRNIIIVGLGYTLLNNILIYFIDVSIYYKVLLIISAIQILLLISSWIMVICKYEKRGLHEIFSNTEMVSLRKKQVN